MSTTTQKIHRVAVFCGAHPGNSPRYAEAAVRLAEALVQKNIGLVYGGAKVGLMGILADTMLQHQAEVIGVMPEFLVGKELAHQGLTQLHMTKSMHERKARIYELSDAFILFCGGLGSLDEFFEIVTWGQLGLHQKPCGILNAENYYAHLQDFLQHATDQGFVNQVLNEAIMVEEHPEVLLTAFELYQAPKQIRYLKKTEGV